MNAILNSWDASATSKSRCWMPSLTRSNKKLARLSGKKEPWAASAKTSTLTFTNYEETNHDAPMPYSFGFRIYRFQRGVCSKISGQSYHFDGALYGGRRN